MREILAGLTAEAWVLDLGSSAGSFPESLTATRGVRLDLHPIGSLAVKAHAGWLPFAGKAFDAVIANHSFEHFQELELVAPTVFTVGSATGAATSTPSCSQ